MTKTFEEALKNAEDNLERSRFGTSYDVIQGLRSQLTAALAREARLRGALSDPEKLEAIADWFDIDDGRYNYQRVNEVQEQLRTWAANIRTALAETKEPGCP